MKESLVGRLFKEAGWAGVPLMEKAANEILRLTAELDAAREALTIANTTAANLHDVIRRKDRELEAARERERRLRDHAEAVAASALPPSRRTTRVGNEALAGLRRDLATHPTERSEDDE